MKKMLYLMRHGQTLFNVQHKMQGWSDSPLTSVGIQQAKRAKKYFQEQDINFDAAYCSTSERASDTLELVTDMPYQRLKGLKELSFGEFEGEPEYLRPQPIPKLHLADYYVQFGGEDDQLAQQRINQTLTDIMNQDDQSVLAVSHAGIMIMFTDWWYDSEKLKQAHFTNCSIIKFSFENQRFSFEGLINP